MPIQLSAVIITFNEEKNIARCINSLQGVADEILVLDSHSTDKTPEICRQKAVKFVTVDWEGYSKTKNKGNALATNDYILSIDADEALSPQLSAEIITLKESGFDNKVYVVNRLTNYCGKWIKHGGWYPDKKPRLWKKDMAYWDGEIHEVLKYNQPIEIKHLKGDLLHYSYYTIRGHIAQVQKFTDITSKALFESGKNAPLYKILFSGCFRFFKGYFLQLGFLDGTAGFRIAKISAFAAYLKYIKIRELNDAAKKSRGNA